MGLRQTNKKLKDLPIGGKFPHRKEGGGRTAGHLLEHKMRGIAVVPQRHPGPRGAQRPLRDGGASLRPAQHLTAAAAAQGSRAARCELDVLTDAPWFIT